MVSFPEIGTGLEIRKISEASITTSFKEMTQRAEITLPRNIKMSSGNDFRSLFKRKTPVNIAFGYDGNLINEFTGYVATCGADIPLKLTCEDEMMLVRGLEVNYSAKQCYLDELLRAILPMKYSINALEGVNLGTVRLPKTTIGEVLKKLQSDFGLYSYFEGHTLKCGKYYADGSSLVSQFNLDRSIAQNSLQYRYGDDISVKIKGVSIRTNGSKIEAELGEDGGDTLTLSYYNINTETELKKLIQLDYDKWKVSGFSGSFDAFGVPSVHFGQKCKLESTYFPDRNGEYYIESVTKVFSQNGIRQTITLGGKVA